MGRELTIDGYTIADDNDCFVIAEIGHNHQGSVEKAKELFVAAKNCGANAVKLQKRDNPSLFTKEMYDSPYDNRNSFGETYGEHREYLEFGRAEYVDLKAFAEELGITFFSTAFDIPSADFLAELDMPAYKIASGDLQNTPLIKHVAGLGKPMIVSTGGGSMDDVEHAYDTVMPINSQLAILQCTSGYPSEFHELNLRVIENFRERFPDTPIGLSSHDNGISMAVVAYVLGARVVEKHFTLNRAWRGTDQAFSLEPNGLRRMIRDLQRARVALGDGIKLAYESEKPPMRKMAKKIVAARDLPKGHMLTAKDVAFKCPGDGLPPCEVERVLGKTILKPFVQDEGVEWDHLGD